IARDPELASDVTVEPVKLLGVDAAVVFADIMLPMEGIGVKFRIEENLGPVIESPVRTKEDVEMLGDFKAEEHVGHVLTTIARSSEKLGETPLVGFSGAPFTLASYLIEGSPSRDFSNTRKMMLADPETWADLMEKLTPLVVEYLRAQTKAGASALQLFDSWVGCLSKEDYVAFVQPYTKRVMESLKGSVPTIHFCANSGHLVESFAETGCNGLSVDWRVPIGEVWERTGGKVSVQGNLEPAVAAYGGDLLRARVEGVMKAARGRRGHVFNLGHGVLRETPPDNLKTIVEMVHSISEMK
ncbi:MAG TPA: uroporphyrinogen decarboxylase, partial [Nitrososphaerales archaeon]|nr:uroporphyrinogen decarboxylase [Nitrososphaerales archaeon]